MIDRHERRNAIDNDTLGALAAAITEIHPSGVRAVLIRGAGGTFCAGSDLHALNAGGAEYAREHARAGQRLFAEIERLPALTIAAVEGYCLGGGVELAMACDVRLAVADSVWGFPEVGLGAIPSWGGTQRLPRFVGLGRAKRLLLTGERLPAARLVDAGLVDEVFDGTDEMLESARALALRASAFPSRPFTLIKDLALMSFDASAADGAWAERLADEAVSGVELTL